MKKNKNLFSLTLMCSLVLGSVSQTVFSAPVTQANKDQIRLHTSTPKKNGESLLSYTVTWRIDGGLTYRSTALTFIQGPDKPKPTSDIEASKKLVIALNDSLEYLYPSWRGALVEQTAGKPEVTISNKQGFDFTQLTFRDYSNQALTYDLLGKRFSSERVGVAIDIVYAADVENIAEFNPSKQKNAKGGVVEVSIAGGKKVSIKTDGKTASQIEKDLANALGGVAKFSATPIFPNIKDETTRNYKPFDGGEVQLVGLSADSITIDINDQSLGTLTKFDFPDVNKPADVAGNLPYVIFLGIAGLLGYFGYNWYKQPKNEEGSDEA